MSKPEGESMEFTIFAREALTLAGWQKNLCVTARDGMIVRVAPGSSGDYRADRLVPGMIDLHNHGGLGFDASRPTLEGCARWTQALARNGITDVLLTVSTNAPETMNKALRFARQAMDQQRAAECPGARIAGVHMEGPFINPLRGGAMNQAYIQMPSVAAYESIVQDYGDVVRLVTLAPELPGAPELTEYLLRRGIRVQAGHTDAGYDQAMEAFANGVDGVCHTFNAARGIHHREPGLLTAALLAPQVYCEMICDTVHLHPAILRLVAKMKGAQHACVVSDAVMATGLPDGAYQSAGHPVILRNGISRTPEGALSGGCAYVSQGVRNLCDAGIASEDAFQMAAHAPAARMGWGELGSIAPGYRAHLTALDEKGRVSRCWVGETAFDGGEG